jgi:hypothetical protein
MRRSSGGVRGITVTFSLYFALIRFSMAAAASFFVVRNTTLPLWM